MSPVVWGDQRRLMVVSDEGGKNERGRYILLHYDQLSKGER